MHSSLGYISTSTSLIPGCSPASYIFGSFAARITRATSHTCHISYLLQVANTAPPCTATNSLTWWFFHVTHSCLCSPGYIKTLSTQIRMSGTAGAAMPAVVISPWRLVSIACIACVSPGHLNASRIPNRWATHHTVSSSPFPDLANLLTDN